MWHCTEEECLQWCMTVGQMQCVHLRWGTALVTQGSNKMKYTLQTHTLTFECMCKCVYMYIGKQSVCQHWKLLQLYLHTDVFNINEFLSVYCHQLINVKANNVIANNVIANNNSAAVNETGENKTGENICRWREKLKEKYTKLQGFYTVKKNML